VRPARVVSLVPSATETLLALGVRPVGCTRFCDLAGVATVGGTKNVDVDAVAALAPGLVIVNDEENRLEDAEALVARGLALHSMSPRSVSDVGPAVCALARAIGVEPPEPFDAWDAWQARTRAGERLSAFIPIWRRPWMSLAADTYGSSLLAHAGIANIFDDSVDRYPEVSLSEVAARAPDVVLLPSEPYAFAERHALELRATVPRLRVSFVDGRDLFWWGTRTPAAAERLQSAHFQSAE
jgi:ABC-type Fe3+-hydroxamate transport system substrate-binding protein